MKNLDLKKLQSFLPYAIMGIAGLIFVFSFFNVLNVTAGGETESLMSGFRSAFGGKVKDMDDAVAGFSFANFLGFYLPVLVAGGMFFVIFKKINKPLVYLGLVALSFIAFMLSLIFIANVGGNVTGDAGDALRMAQTWFGDDILENGFGAVMVVILAILGMISSGYYTYLLGMEEYKKLNK